MTAKGLQFSHPLQEDNLGKRADKEEYLSQLLEQQLEITPKAAATSQALQSAFADSMRAELSQYTGGAVGSNSRCQLVTAEMNQNRAYLRSNPSGLADNGAGQTYSVRDRNQQLSNWYNQNCR